MISLPWFRRALLLPGWALAASVSAGILLLQDVDVDGVEVGTGKLHHANLKKWLNTADTSGKVAGNNGALIEWHWGWLALKKIVG